MVGLNLSGVVSGNELKQVTQEIFGKAKGFTPKNPKAKKELTPQVAKTGNVGLSRSASKMSKAGFNQNSNVQMNESIQSMVKSQAAIDRYGQLSFKNSNINEIEPGKYPELSSAEQILDAYGAKKDRDGKNPFSFFEQASEETEHKIEKDFSKSIFAVEK